jgi:hypothetical protein
VYSVSVKELPEMKNSTFVRRLFQNVIRNIKQKMEASSDDYILVIINHPSLDPPF